MTSLTSILALYGLVVLITIVVQVVAAGQKLGLSTLAGNRETLPSLTGAAGRLDRAQMNSVVAMALFAPPVLILHMQGVTDGFALLCAQAFLLARILYVIVYAVGVPWIRTAMWTVGFIATFCLYLLAL